MAMKTLNRKKLDTSTPVFTGIKYSEELSLQLFRYNQDDYVEKTNFSEKEIEEFSDLTSNYWLNINRIHDVEHVKSICDKLGIHNLVIQDILDVNQRPKVQEFEEYCFFSMKSILPSNNIDIESEQISFILGKNFLVSFQEKKMSHFEHVNHRIREKVGIIRERGTDYLLFLLLESILDNYFKTIDFIEKEEEKSVVIDINTDPSPTILKTIELFKRQIQLVKRTITPVKDFVTKIEREQFILIHQKHIKYFLELKDMCLVILDNCDKIEIRLESKINLFFSVQGRHMNQVMKTLTIIATIFIPLTFIAGIYGMNFTNMPELTWRWGYLGVWFIIVIVFIGMIIYLKKKKLY